MFCKKCGMENGNDAKFCTSCGSSIAEEKEIPMYDGKIKKCPNCGELVDSFTLKCKACGYEFRDTKVTFSLKEFTNKLQSFDEVRIKNRSISENEIINMKITYIGSYAIPNNKEDILEFMIIASSNISTSNVNAKNFKNVNLLNQAWISKMEQAYEKANLTIKDNGELDRIEKIYNDKKTQVASLNRKMALRQLVFPIILAIAVISIFIGSMVKNGDGFMMLGLLLICIVLWGYLLKMG